MKNWILWSFNRGSFQYDVLCGLILVAIFAIPARVFNDRPAYMQVPEAGEIRRSVDGNENAVYTVKVNGEQADRTESGLRQEALADLQGFLNMESLPETYRVEAIYDTRGSLEAFAFWVK